MRLAVILEAAYRTPPCPREGLSLPMIVFPTIRRRIFFFARYADAGH
jgi:hypothetical protein